MSARCDDCGKQFTAIEFLKQHIKRTGCLLPSSLKLYNPTPSIVLPLATFSCDGCKRPFTESGIRDHKKHCDPFCDGIYVPQMKMRAKTSKPKPKTKKPLQQTKKNLPIFWDDHGKDMQMQVKRKACSSHFRSIAQPSAIKSCDACNRPVSDMDGHKKYCDPFRDGILMPDTQPKQIKVISKRKITEKEDSNIIENQFPKKFCVRSRETEIRKPLWSIGNITQT